MGPTKVYQFEIIWIATLGGKLLGFESEFEALISVKSVWLKEQLSARCLLPLLQSKIALEFSLEAMLKFTFDL